MGGKWKEVSDFGIKEGGDRFKRNVARRKEAGEEVAEAVFLAGSGDVAFVERGEDPGLGGGHGGAWRGGR